MRKSKAQAQAEFSQIAQHEHPRVFRAAYMLCGDRQVAEDAVSDALFRVYTKWRRGHVENLGAYLRKAVIHEVVSGFRRRGLERRAYAKLREDSDSTHPVDEAVADREALRIALTALGPRQRAVIVLRYFEDMSEADTAALLGLKVGTVKSQASRGIARLRALLQKEEREHDDVL